MKRRGPGRIIGWLATGATLAAAGVLLGATAGVRRGRPVPALLADSPAAARLDDIAAAVVRLEARVSALEDSTASLGSLGQRVLQIEERLIQLRAGSAAPPLERAVVEAERRLIPRLEALEARLREHHEAIRQLSTRAVRSEADLRRIMAALQKDSEALRVAGG